MEIIASRINWWLGYMNSPELELLVDELPQHHLYKKYLIGYINDSAKNERKDVYLYHSEVNGFVNKYTYSGKGEGFGGRSFTLQLTDGTTETIVGPYDSAWINSMPVERYHSVTLHVGNWGNIGYGGYVTESKLNQIINDNHPYAELKDDNIVRAGYASDYPSKSWHGLLKKSKQEYDPFTLSIYWLPETGESMWAISGVTHESGMWRLFGTEVGSETIKGVYHLTSSYLYQSSDEAQTAGIMAINMLRNNANSIVPQERIFS